MKKELTIKTKYKFGDLINPRLGNKELMIVSLQINKDKTYSYGCADENGDWKWFKEYEIKKSKPIKSVDGFKLKLK